MFAPKKYEINQCSQYSYQTKPLVGFKAMWIEQAIIQPI
jgi:hypothetical protein